MKKMTKAIAENFPRCYFVQSDISFNGIANFMKYVGSILLLLVCTIHVGSAQLHNYSFSSNNGNDQTPGSNPPSAPNPPCNSSFEPGSISTGPGTLDGWYRSIGTAEIVNGCEVLNDAIKFIGQNRLGQGIVQEYHFKAGETYKICFKLINWDISDAQFEAVLAENLAQEIYPTCLCVCSPPIISMGAMQSVTLPLPSGANEPCTTTFEKNVTFTANADFDYFYVLFKSTKSDNIFNHIVLDAIDVVRECNPHPNLYFDDVSNNPAPGYYKAYERIYAGSSINGGSSTPVHTDPNASTIFEAKYEVELKDNFRAEVNENNFFLATVDPKTCAHCRVSVPEGRNAGNQAALLNIKDNSPGADSWFKIYPNPNDGTFTIALSQTGDYDIRVLNALGVEVYKTRLVNEKKRVIQLDRWLPAGSYIVRMAGNGQIHNERISVMR